ncbi:MAG: riboflavin biosynthesis protein RibF [Lachnospiraceae bacterium]|nr:riboflavin biosynthesis protein RibF [Lachnospiraceae bacterium]
MVHITKAADAVIESGCAITIGKFDGIHAGHQALIEAVKKAAADQGLKTVVFTFAVSPSRYLGKEAEMLMTPGERVEYLESLGIDYLIEYPFTDEVRQMEAGSFVKHILFERLHVKYLAVGYDFRFGYQRQGDCSLLKKYAESGAFVLDICRKLKYNEREISSSFIREQIRMGKMEAAEAMLGRPYSFCGIVEHGKSLGHTIGFPTLNIRPAEQKVLPPNGVYFTTVHINGISYRGVANLGIQPTVTSHQLLLEVHVLDFCQMVYDSWVSVDLHKFHRPEQRFAGVGELTRQLALDTAACIRYFEEMRGK